eukprot:m.270427 g.270427  ORF g.270427 m.270427 type:complete len:420 (-) comp16263_c8_seq1:129-1388(-)
MSTLGFLNNIMGVDNDFWLTNLLGNILSYMVIILPGVFLIRYLRENPKYMTGQGCMQKLLRACVIGDPDPDLTIEKEKEKTEDKKEEDSFMVAAFKLMLCVLGLQGSYLTWGLLQEQIMTQSYGTEPDGSDAVFKTSQFLVFMNRVLAFCVAIGVTRLTEQPKHKSPLYKYSFTSMSNVMSSWFQYEALKYVSFPTAVLGKASKVIPVMIMGRFVQGQTYKMWEYGCAAALSLGVAMFMWSRVEDNPSVIEDKTTSFSGLFLMVGYMMFDSFTSNYQSGLFKSYQMSKFQMMFGVNMFSCMFTLWSLILNGQLLPAISFTLRYPKFMFHVIILSITSATGQMFIFHTIATYGALVFTIIMTTRQVLSIFLSAVFFGHSFNAQGWIGIAVVAGSLFAKIYLQHKEKEKKKAAAANNDAKK